MKKFLNLLALLVVVLVLHSRQAHAQASLAQCQEDLKNIGGAFGTSETKAVLETGDCEQRLVLCVDATGYPLATEGTNPHLQSGETLLVKLFGPESCQGVLTVRTDLSRSDVTLFAPTGTQTIAPAEESVEPPPPPIKIAQLAKATATTDNRTESMAVTISRTDPSKLSVHGITLVVTPPRYYLDVGLLVAFTPAYQKVSTQRSPGSQEQFVRETDTIRVAAAITVNYFPFGQYAVPRFSGYHGLGFQAGIGGNLDRIDDEFYMGLLWEPIPGAGISAGLALLEMEKLQPDYPTGALVTPNDVPRDTFLGPRFFFGVSLNTQVFQTVLSLGSKAHVPNY